MTEEAKRLVESLREDAEWARGNEWEAPIMLSDDLTAAADMIDELAKDRDKWKSWAKAAAKDIDKAVENLPCDVCAHYNERTKDCNKEGTCKFVWRGPCAGNRM